MGTWGKQNGDYAKEYIDTWSRGLGKRVARGMALRQATDRKGHRHSRPACAKAIVDTAAAAAARKETLTFTPVICDSKHSPRNM